jgi:ankyrin repeat protein
MLLDRGAKIEAKTCYGNTPLHYAVKSKIMEYTELLVKRRADVNVRNRKGITPLHLATETSRVETVKLLLKYGAYVNSACTSTFWEGYTPLCDAVQVHENIVSEYNSTPLDFAVAGIRSFYSKVDSYDSEDYYYHDDHDCQICACEKIAKILKNHMVKMKTANLYVSKKNYGPLVTMIK